MASLQHKDYDGAYPVHMAFTIEFRADGEQDGLPRYGAECAIVLGREGAAPVRGLGATLLDLTADDLTALSRDLQGLLSGERRLSTWSPAEPEIVLEIAARDDQSESDDSSDEGAEMVLSPHADARATQRSFRAQLLIDSWAFGVGGSFSGDGVGMEMEVGEPQLRAFAEELAANMSRLGL